MIKVMLKDGRTVEVEEGLQATYTQTVKNVFVDNVIETNLEVSDKAGYGGKIVASFKACEVIAFFVLDTEKEEDE